MLARRRVLHRTPFEERPPREGSRRWLVAELDRLVSLIVRRRDRRCVTCGEPRGLQCSHFYSRRYLATRFDLRNCNAMCANCNRRHNEDPGPYLLFMRERYGDGVVEELEGLRDGREKVTDEELREALERLRALA
jgi:5-methylcytosine-specific restriction endonuclease McrA